MIYEPYLHSAKDVLLYFQVRGDIGLSGKHLTHRRAKWGANILPSGRSVPLWLQFLDRFRDVLVLILLGAVFVSLALGRLGDAVIIGVAILFDVTLSFIQIWRTERTLASLRKYVQPVALVLRDGSLRRVASTDLVVGDIIEIRAGENVPADARLLSTTGLTVREATLTGEASDIEKTAAALHTRTPVASRRNMVWLGTTVTNGSGRAVVVAVGTRTEFGKIAQVLKTEKSPDSPLRRKLQQTGLYVGGGIIVAVLVLVVIGILLGQDTKETLLTAITLVVSAIPEDLTMILTIALTVGVRRILKQRGVVRELRSGETLGAATVICVDKTGTLTTGRMEARELLHLQGDRLASGDRPQNQWQELAYTALALTADAHQLPGSGWRGSQTEQAAVAFAERGGLVKTELQKKWRQRDVLSFSSRWKYRASLHDHPTQGAQCLFVLGAPELLLAKSHRVLTPEFTETTLTTAGKKDYQQQINTLAASGVRLLAVAVRRHLNQTEITHADVVDLTFVGVLVVADPVRTDVAKALHSTVRAGIDVKIVTGDHPATARAVARAVGITATDATILTSEAMEELSDHELQQVIESTQIFARVTPLDKQRIVQALQHQGHVVAMTGDGVNDAVALRSADIGVAMGSGTDLAKEAADLVLLDDSFTTIAAAVREGRVLRDNVRKVIAFLLATNMAEVAIFIVSIIFQLPLPLLPAQILWVNLVTDGTSDIALSLEPAENDVMRRQPEHPAAALLGRRLWLHMAVTGIIMTAATMGIYWYALTYLVEELPYARTLAFMFISLTSLLSVWSFRSLTQSMYSRGFTGNVWVFFSTGASFALQLLAVYFPPLQHFFGTVPLPLTDWLVLAVIAVLTVLVIDLRKWWFPYSPSATA